MKLVSRKVVFRSWIYEPYDAVVVAVFLWLWRASMKVSDMT